MKLEDLFCMKLSNHEDDDLVEKLATAILPQIPRLEDGSVDPDETGCKIGELLQEPFNKLGVVCKDPDQALTVAMGGVMSYLGSLYKNRKNILSRSANRNITLAVGMLDGSGALERLVPWLVKHGFTKE